MSEKAESPPGAARPSAPPTPREAVERLKAKLAKADAQVAYCNSMPHTTVGALHNALCEQHKQRVEFLENRISHEYRQLDDDRFELDPVIQRAVEQRLIALVLAVTDLVEGTQLHAPAWPRE